MATHSGILDWEIPLAEEPGELQSVGSQRVWHAWVNKQQQVYYIGDFNPNTSKKGFWHQRFRGKCQQKYLCIEEHRFLWLNIVQKGFSSFRALITYRLDGRGERSIINEEIAMKATFFKNHTTRFPCVHAISLLYLTPFKPNISLLCPRLLCWLK